MQPIEMQRQRMPGHLIEYQPTCARDLDRPRGDPVPPCALCDSSGGGPESAFQFFSWGGWSHTQSL